MEISGIDADFIVTQLMEIEAIPLTRLEARKTDAKVASDAIAAIKSKVDAFRLAAEKLQYTSAFTKYTSSVSDDSVISASISGSAAPGAFSFVVNRLASAHGLRSIGTVSSDNVAITTADVLAVASATADVGISSVRAGAGLGEGDLEVRITQSSAGARSTGSVLGGFTMINAGVNDTIDVTINGAARTLTIADGVYDQTGLANAVQAAIDATGGGATASIDAAGALAITTTREGSSATLQITGGSALATVGMSVDAAARTGTDGLVDIGGTITTVTLAEEGQAVALDTGAGTLDVTLSGGLRVGSADVAVVSTGDKSLADVTAAINAANNGVTASAVNVSDGAWRLQLNSTTTGLDGEIAIDTSVFTGLGGMIESSAAQDAQITIGSGPGAYTVDASGNTFSNVIAGVTVTAKKVSADPVTVGVTRDDAAITKNVANMVTKINELLADIKVQTRADPESGTSGALNGNSTIRSVADRVRAALANQVSGLALSLPYQVGIERDRDGSFTFDEAKFTAALQDDPDAVAALFAQGGTSTGDARFLTAAGTTVSGSYAVDVTTAATQATSIRLFDGGAVADTRIGVRIGATSALVDVQTGETPAQIIAKLNAAFAEADLDVVAAVDATGLVIRADDWGSAGDFELNTDVLGAGTWDAQTGTDVVGTIDGLLATGTGRKLTLATSADSNAAGLSVEIAAGVTGALNPVEYRPGLAARVVEVTNLLTDGDTGTLSTAQEFASKRIEDFNDQIERYEDRLVVREATLRRQWASMQTLLGQLQAQGDWLSGQLANLPKIQSAPAGGS